MNSFIGWIGGKKLLRKEIIARFPEEYGRYVEVFGGAGWVLFGLDPKPGRMEVYNDANSDLVNLFRCVKYPCRCCAAGIGLDAALTGDVFQLYEPTW